MNKVERLLTSSIPSLIIPEYSFMLFAINSQVRSYITALLITMVMKFNDARDYKSQLTLMRHANWPYLANT